MPAKARMHAAVITRGCYCVEMGRLYTPMSIMLPFLLTAAMNQSPPPRQIVNLNRDWEFVRVPTRDEASAHRPGIVLELHFEEGRANARHLGGVPP